MTQTLLLLSCLISHFPESAADKEIRQLQPFICGLKKQLDLSSKLRMVSTIAAELQQKRISKKVILQ
jgi:hypothetical protein